MTTTNDHATTTHAGRVCYRIAPQLAAEFYAEQPDPEQYSEDTRPRASLAIVSTAPGSDYSDIAAVELVGDVETVRAMLAALDHARQLARHVAGLNPHAGDLGPGKCLTMQHHAGKVLGLSAALLGAPTTAAPEAC